MRLIRMQDHGSFIGSRFTGREIRDQVEAALAAGDQVGLDFRSVQSVSDSFLDELLGMLIVRRGPTILGSLVFLGCDKEIAAAIRFSVEDALSQGAPLTFS